VWEEWVSQGGRLWAAGAPGIAAVTAPRLAVSGGPLATSVRAMVTGNAGAGVDIPQASIGYAAWAAWPGGGVNGHWVDIDYGGIGADVRYVAGEGTTGDIRRTGGTALPWTLAFTLPGFAGGITCIAHTHHAPDDLYPGDPGNHAWLALTAAETSVSTHATANVWTPALAHAILETPMDVACSKLTGEWIAVANASGICRSMDGLAWTRAAVGTAGGLYATIVGPTTARIATDGYGHWMVLLVDSGAGTAEYHASYDDGATWYRVYEDLVVPALIDGALWYGHGQFHVLVTTGATGAIYSTPRVAE
jgi:hypothetical protein